MAINRSQSLHGRKSYKNGGLIYLTTITNILFSVQRGHWKNHFYKASAFVKVGIVYSRRLEDCQQKCSQDDYDIVRESLHKRRHSSKTISKFTGAPICLSNWRLCCFKIFGHNKGARGKGKTWIQTLIR